jgi:hypothetical protein
VVISQALSPGQRGFSLLGCSPVCCPSVPVLPAPFWSRFIAPPANPRVSPPCACSLVLDNVFLNSDRLVRAVSNHYLIQGLQEIHKILGSLDLLGSPVSLVHSLGTGVMDFFTEPAKATT